MNGKKARAHRRAQPQTLADAKATHARATASARLAAAITDMEVEDVVPGVITCWRLGEAAALLPAILPGAPEEVHEWSRDRALADLTGLCPRCSEASSVVAVYHGVMAHEHDCVIGDAQTPRHYDQWFSHEGMHALDIYVKGVSA